MTSLGPYNGVSLKGLVLQLRHLIVELGYTEEVQFVGTTVPDEGEKELASPRWSVKATLLSTNPSLESLELTGGTDTFIDACQEVVLLGIGRLLQRHWTRLQHTPFRYHPTRSLAEDYATFRDAEHENDTTIDHLAKMVQAYDDARVDYYKMAKRGFIQASSRILRLRRKNLCVKLEMASLKRELRNLELGHGQVGEGSSVVGSKRCRVGPSLKITTRKRDGLPPMVHDAQASARVIVQNYLERRGLTVALANEDDSNDNSYDGDDESEPTVDDNATKDE
ncbi:uncharacterized protein [Oryza sativa Japonica Group]